MKINFVKMNQVIHADRSTELLDTNLRNDLTWLSKEYRRIANVLKTKTDLTKAERNAFAEVNIGTPDIGIADFGTESIAELIEYVLNLASIYAKRSTESGSSRGQRRAYSRTGIKAERWDMTELDPEVA